MRFVTVIFDISTKVCSAATEGFIQAGHVFKRKIKIMAMLEGKVCFH